jgi:hypothetical protein
VDMDTIVRIGLIALVAIAVLTAMPGVRGTSSTRNAPGARSARVRRGPHDTGSDHTPGRTDRPVGHHTGSRGQGGGPDSCRDGGPGNGGSI